MKLEDTILKTAVQLQLGLFILVFFSSIAFAQIEIPNLELQNIKAKKADWTYIDTAFQHSLPDWRREFNGKPVLLNFAFHKPGKELILFLEFNRRLSKKDLSTIEFIVTQDIDSTFLAFQKLDSNTIKLRMQELNVSSTLSILANKELIGTLEIDVFPKRREQLYLIPLIEINLNEAKIEKKINLIFKPFNLSFNVHILPSFYSDELEKNPNLDNPSPDYDHYTRQMRNIRDEYFNDFPKSNRRAYYVFIHRGFVNDLLEGYAAKGKAIAFIKTQDIDALAYQISVQLARGIGGMEFASEDQENVHTLQNLMSALGGTALTPNQWRQLHLDFRGYPYYDEDEEINTFNGFVAYYFWEENEDGTIVFNPGAFRRSIQRPYKKNYFSYHLNIEKRLFKPWFTVVGFPISPLHVFLFTLFTVSAYWLRKRWERKITIQIERKLKIKRIFIRLILSILVLFVTTLSFSTINSILAKYEVYDGVVPDFRGFDTQEVRKEILYNSEIKRSSFPEMASEVLIKRGQDWIVKRRKRVLYFDLYKDSLGIYSKAKFNRESDSIILPSAGVSILAPSHYFVINRIDENKNYELQRVFNHQGSNVTELLKLKNDPAKRILLFVNGYRPTSLGNSLEENFRDIRARGVEFPDSKNMIYDFDRYDYWRPWREIDLKFEKRINPSETYYADGHFSVSTSNYRSLIHFTQVSARYPTRCKDPNHHTCQNQGRTSWFRSSDDATHHLLPNRPNYSGFNKRKDNGKIAGVNLLQQLNEIPNSSENDTLYIIAHSMGYAYALGMIEELRGKINFGGFYILAPENAEAGYVNREEWKELWQYSVNHEALKKTAPCMLDGVAPQTLAKGLTRDNQIFIPNKLYRRFGFFDAHFIGFYDWIFDLKKNKKGHILQR